MKPSENVNEVGVGGGGGGEEFISLASRCSSTYDPHCS